MLCRLTINNYILIDHLDVDFNTGFNAITGETGAGKSIILGALGIALGQRVDTKSLGKKNVKCSIEVEFSVSRHYLEHFFANHDLDFFNQTIIRREISPTGRSRAFINDTPVSLGILKELSTHLIDIHSQHQSLLLNNNNYQLTIIDAYSCHEALLDQYKEEYQKHSSLKSTLNSLIEKESNLKKELDYKQFLLDEINTLNPILEKDSSVEKELNVIENFEDISAKLAKSLEISETDDASITILFNQLQSILNAASLNDDQLLPLTERINSLQIEFKDCLYELNTINDKYNQDYDPQKLTYLRERSSLINKLLFKHSLRNIEELIFLKQSLENELNNVHHLSDEIKRLSQQISIQHANIIKLSKKLSNSRLSNLSKLENEIQQLTSSLGMPHSTFKIEHHLKDSLNSNGVDEFSFLFSANKGVKADEISKIASGGEISRLMLIFKYILAKTAQLSSILFDEIDTGVSGEIAHRMADVMKNMSTNMQVISITHLPQVAAKANTHFLVSKIETKTTTYSTLKELNYDERVNEIAKMLSGKSITDSSIKNAEDLLAV